MYLLVSAPIPRDRRASAASPDGMVMLIRTVNVIIVINDSINSNNTMNAVTNAIHLNMLISMSVKVLP